MTFNTPLHMEYNHTGVIYETIKKGEQHRTQTSSPEIAADYKAKGYKVEQLPGYYYIDRMAIPTVNAKGQPDVWYINNAGDTYSINKVSKYGRKIHQLLSNNKNPFAQC